MSTSEMKKIIHEKVEKLNDAQLNELDNYITRINNLPAGEWDLSDHIENIVSERAEVLKKLAQ